MKLFTKGIDKKLFAQFPKGGSLEGQKVIAKVFNPYGRGRWYIMNSDPDEPNYLWGIVQLFEGEPEVGSFSREELENIKVGAFKLPLERDLYFDEMDAMEVYNGLKSGKTFEHGGEMENRKTLKVGDAYLYRDETHYLVKRNGEVGLVSYAQGAWGGGGKFLPLQKMFRSDLEENLTDFKGNKLNIPSYDELMQQPYGFMEHGGEIDEVAEMLKGKYVNIFSMGVENPISTDIVEAKMSDPKFRYQTLSLSTRGGGEERIEGKEKINAFLKGEMVYVRDSSEEYGIQLIDTFDKGGKLKYISKRNITNVTIKYEGKEYIVSGDDVITGAYKFAKGGLSDTHIYIPKRDVVKVTTKEGESINSPLNGVWVKKEYFDGKEAKGSGEYEPSQATKVFAYKLTELAKDKELKASTKDSMILSLSMVDDFVNDLKYEIENNISGLAIETYANAVKSVSKKNKLGLAKDLTLYENPNAIKLFPESFTKTPLTTKKAISMKGNLLDNNAFLSELGKFTSDDSLRPAMTAIRFDGKNVVATDANVLVHIYQDNSVEPQNLCVTKICEKSKGEDARYPMWKEIIARDLSDSKYSSATFDLDKLIVLTNWINNYNSVTDYRMRQVSITTEKGDITFNPELLLKSLSMLKVIGMSKPIMYFESNNRGVYFGKEGQLSGDPMYDNFVLVMPLLSVNSQTFSLDVRDNEYKIVNPNFWKYAKGGELEMGIKTEMEEHGMSKANATKTAKDHLRENPKYYSIMKKVGLEEGGQLTLFATGGATFDDKVRAIKRNLVGKKVPSKYQGEYGKRYDKDEAEESAKRIAGAMVKK
jgi:hypothetical protein